MVKKDDRIFELVSIYDDGQEFSLGLYSSEKIANEQKDECEKQAEKTNLFLEYMVKNRRIIK